MSHLRMFSTVYPGWTLPLSQAFAFDNDPELTGKPEL